MQACKKFLQGNGIASLNREIIISIMKVHRIAGNNKDRESVRLKLNGAIHNGSFQYNRLAFRSFTVHFRLCREFVGGLILEVDNGHFFFLRHLSQVFRLKLNGNLEKTRPGLHVAICNPLSVSYYMRSFGMNKTDKADAAAIARYAAHVRPCKYREPSRDEAELKRLTRDRTFMVDSRTQYKNRLGSEADARSRERIRRVIKALDKEIDGIDREIAEYIAAKASAECRNEIELMKSVPGVRTTSAAVIYGELGSLSGYTRKQLSAMSGICPTTLQSGTSLRKGGLSKRGSKWLRRILFLDSQQTILRSPAMAAFHEKMLSKPDSTTMGARVACMRKLLLVLRGIVVSGKPFDPNHISARPTLPAKITNDQEKSEVTA